MEGCSPAAGSPTLFDGTFARGTGKPLDEHRTFSGQGSGLACVTAQHVHSGDVTLNSVALLGKSDFKGGTFTRSVAVDLIGGNDLGVEITGKPCGVAGDSDCATMEVKVFGPASPPTTLQVSASTAPDACCHDPTCDRQAFAKQGGICPGDPRIKGPLPPTVRAAAP